MKKALNKTESVIALGSNKPSEYGEPTELVERALEKLGHISESNMEVSSFFWTRAEGLEPGAAKFLNAVAIITLNDCWSPIGLLRTLKQIELELGRHKDYGPKIIVNAYYQSRPIDLDIITYGSAQIDIPGLVIPHERAWKRLFVLEPLAELRPKMTFPGSAKTVSELKQALLSC
jgi:2-amino-4-hydroxy-6-hydroxymethyldihydropteridine diphosphokinase